MMILPQSIMYTTRLRHIRFTNNLFGANITTTAVFNYHVYFRNRKAIDSNHDMIFLISVQSKYIFHFSHDFLMVLLCRFSQFIYIKKKTFLM